MERRKRGRGRGRRDEEEKRGGEKYPASKKALGPNGVPIVWHERVEPQLLCIAFKKQSPVVLIIPVSS